MKRTGAFHLGSALRPWHRQIKYRHRPNLEADRPEPINRKADRSEELLRYFQPTSGDPDEQNQEGAAVYCWRRGPENAEHRSAGAWQHD
jgi:hypothetical protein